MLKPSQDDVASGPHGCRQGESSQRQRQDGGRPRFRSRVIRSAPDPVIAKPTRCVFIGWIPPPIIGNRAGSADPSGESAGATPWRRLSAERCTCGTTSFPRLRVSCAAGSLRRGLCAAVFGAVIFGAAQVLVVAGAAGAAIWLSNARRHSSVWRSWLKVNTCRPATADSGAASAVPTRSSSRSGW